MPKHTTVNRRELFGLPLACLVALSFGGVVRAGDWPAYLHDNARSGVTSESLQLPLTERWHYTPSGAPEPAWDDPKPVPVEGFLELPRVKFDDAYYSVSANGLVYFASAAENRVCALDAATGKEVWSFFTEASPRLAPALWEGRLYFGADDGFVYCLNAADGKPVWRFRAAPADLMVLGHGRMISLWPVRTGVLVDAGVVYFGAGIFPAERVFLYALDAKDGSLLWKNDTLDDRNAGQGSFTPQGYLLATKTRLYAPTGRTMPASFDRATGNFVAQRNIYKDTAMVGGTYALLDGDNLYTGTQEITGVDDQGAGKFAWFRGKRLLFSTTTSYLLSDFGITALSRGKYPELSTKRKGMEVQRGVLADQANREKDKAKAATLKEQLAALDQELATLNGDIDAVGSWKLQHKGLESMIVAGDTLFAGGNNEVLAVNAATGESLWTGSVDGVAKGLAVAAGRLLVSTDKGALYCFAGGGESLDETATRSDEPFPKDELTPVFAAAAQRLVKETGITSGYCLVWGCGTGRLAAELARRTNLRIYGVERDAAKVSAARAALNAAGLYGTHVTIHQDDLSKVAYTDVPYADYFANLIVSESALISGELPGSPREVFRMLKPMGGTLYLGQPTNAGLAVTPLAPNAIRQWLGDTDLQGAKADVREGWTKLVRGRLPNTADWSHQYANAGNVAATADALVKCPLGVLWFGEPGPDKAVNRHEGAAAPLVVGGRCFLQGELLTGREGKPRIMAFDAYNGQMLWEKEVPGAKRVAMHVECSNLAATEDSLYVATGKQCLRLDALTGETRATYEVPASPDGSARNWGYVAVADGLLFGSATSGSQRSDAVFAVDPDTGQQRWLYRGKSIKHNSLTISDGRLFFADRAATPADRQVALAARIDELRKRKNIDAAAAEKELTSADVRLVVALDAKSGNEVWRKAVDLTDCSSDPSDVLVAMCQNGVLLFAGAHRNGHFWPQFLGGEYAARTIVALSAADGSKLWGKPVGYRIRPLIIGDTVYAEPWAFDLRTGEQKLRIHPVTGRQSVWQFERPGHHCGTVCGSTNALFFRSGSIAWYDLIADQGTNHFAGQRTGCWINMIPAGGLVVVPEGSSGCVCPFPIQTTVVFAHREANKQWGIYSAPGEALPVRHLCVNLGAPGDRRGPDGNLWLSYPRPYGRMPLAFSATLTNFPGQTYFSEPAELGKTQGTAAPWLYTSGAAGLRKCVVPLVGAADGSALYTVRLSFADRENTAAGQRVFDIKLQGKTVAEGFDIIQAAGGRDTAVVKEFPGVQVDGDLTVELVPKETTPAPNQMPLLNALEVIREQTLSVGMAAPSFLVSDVDKEQSGTVALVNNTDADFVGTLRVTAPAGFAVTPAETPVNLAKDAKLTLELKASVAKPGDPGNLQVTLSLIRQDGTTETERTTALEYLGPRHRLVIDASEDSYAGAGQPTANFGHLATLLVDGGGAAMGDNSHNIGYLRFPLQVPGKVVSVKLLIHTAPSEASESGDSGKIHLVDEPWEEYTLTYANRPKPGTVVGTLGRVGRDTLEERELKVDLTGRKELSLVLEPTSTDGANYYAREGGKGPQLVVEYVAE